MHLVFFVAVVKIVTGRTDRDYLFLKVIAFMELLAACVLSTQLNFLVFLLLFLVLGVATFASDEIRHSGRRRHSLDRVSGKGLSVRLVSVVVFVSAGILVITAGLFFFLPRTARAAFQHLASHRYHMAGFSNHVTLGEIGEIKRENTPVMHVKMDQPEDRGLALKWRGATLSEFNGRAWFNRSSRGQVLSASPGGNLRLDDEAQRRAGSRNISYAVYLNDIAADALFFAGTPQYVRIDATVIRHPFDNYNVQTGGAHNISYQVYSRLDAPDRDARPTRGALETRRRAVSSVYLQLPRLDPRIRAAGGGYRRQRNIAARAGAI